MSQRDMEVDLKVGVINSMLREKGGGRVEVDHSAQGVRITTRQGSKDVSPRMVRKEALLWLDGFIAGMDYKYL